MTSMVFHPGTPQYVRDQWIDPMTGTNLKGEKPPQGPRQQNIGIMGLQGYQGGQNPTGYSWSPHQRPLPFGTSGDPFAPPQQPTQQPPQQNPWQQPPRQQNPWMGMGLGAMANIQQMTGQMTGFGEQMGGFGEQMGGFGEQLGGYKDLLGGYGEQLGGFGEQLGGFKDEFSGINDKLQNLEQGISSLTDKFGTQQQSPYQQNFGMNPFGSINSYTPFFGGLGAFMRRY